MSNPKIEINLSNSSFMGVLFLIFLTLKLSGTIEWSWWWVTAPFWGPVALVLSVIGVAVVICALWGCCVVLKDFCVRLHRGH